MKADEIRRIVDELDKSIPKGNARVSLQKYGDDLDEASVVANEHGYLRLGVEFLKAGIAPHVPPEKTLGERPHAIEVELDYLITEDSDVHFDYFERREDVTVETYQDTLADRLIALGIIGVILSTLALAVVGLMAVIKALF